MNKVWIIEKKIGDEVDYFLGAETEFYGLKQALFEIVNEFTDNPTLWDMSDTHLATQAHYIYLLAKSSRLDDLRNAVGVYNSVMTSYSNPVHKWTVFSTNVQEPEDIVELDDSFFGIEEDEEPTQQEVKDDTKVAAISNGATCRKCHNYNEYAASDTCDNTYECSQCKAFIKVFGSIN